MAIEKSVGAQQKNDNKPKIKNSLDKIQNSSAVAKNFLPAIEKLKKVTSNPTAVNSIGAQNYSAINSQISSFYSSQGKQDKEAVQ